MLTCLKAYIQHVRIILYHVICCSWTW